MSNLKFVVHKHNATTVHFDLRLEVNGVMPSWAVPRGPTLDPTQKRLAIKTPDHALSYRKFEGTIPEGSYGAGPVEIWDEGTYEAEREKGKGLREIIKDPREAEEVMSEGIEKGEIKFFMHGKILRGSFALVKTKNFPPRSKADNWLLIKHKDKYDKAGFDAKVIN